MGTVDGQWDEGEERPKFGIAEFCASRDRDGTPAKQGRRG